MTDEEMISVLIGLIQRGKITLEQIKDTEHRAAVEVKLTETGNGD